MENFRNILLIQFGDIGDVVLTTPTIRAVRDFYPEAMVSILVHKPFGALLKADPAIYEIHEFAKVKGFGFLVLYEYLKFVRRLRRARYDLVIDLRTGDRGAFFSILTGATHRIGYRADDKKIWHSIAFTKIVRALPEWPKSNYPGAEHSLGLLRGIGIDAKTSAPKLYVAQDDRERVALLLADYGLEPKARFYTINPFSRWSYKEWEREKWVKVINSIWDKFSIPAIIVGSAEESAAAEEIIAGCKGNVFNLAGKINLGELSAIIAKSTLHLGVDSAAPHIAAALGTPTVTIHGPSDWRVWRVVNDLNVIIFPPMDCVPCSHRGCDDTEVSQCLEQLDAHAVTSAVEELLRKLICASVSEQPKAERRSEDIY
ncbi:MAG: putative lipopolysaccharide heptosyltransferase III [Deltaproteobacteria bacterium]